MDIKYQTIDIRSKVINIYSKIDSWFWIKGSINPYRGCEHDCKYCDGKAEWYHIKNFGTYIQIKVDSPQQFERELLKMGYEADCRSKKSTLEAFVPEFRQKNLFKTKRIPRFPIAVGGGVCDVYQPAEKKYKVTRQLLMRSRDFGMPVTVLTKSSLVLRDFDLLSEINNHNYANVSFSITLKDEKVRRIFEPKSVSTARRFKALKSIRKQGLHGGIMLMPILPGIGDTEENLKHIVQKAKEVKAEFILPGGLTLKPGKNKHEYLSVITRHFPRLTPLYEDLYGNNNKYGVPNTHSKNNLNVCKLVHEYCREVSIPDRIPRYIPPEVNHTNFLVSTIMLNLAYYYQWVEGKNRKSISHYTSAAEEIESLPIDISKIKIEELETRIQLPKEIFNVVSEVLETGRSTELSKYQEPKAILAT